MHYFRVPKGRWKDVFYKAKLMGLNTIETYIAWNAHEPNEGEYCFSGMYDIEFFLEEAKKAGLYAIVRPGPYICAEWDFGGFPYWLLNKPDIRFICMNDSYLNEVSKWFDVILPKIAKHTLENGGNVIAVQVENEYGSYGNDTQYLSWIKNKMSILSDTFFFTSDGPEDSMLQGAVFLMFTVWRILEWLV